MTGFGPVPSLEAWRTLASKELEGRALESLPRRTADGIAIPLLATPVDLDTTRHLGCLPLPAPGTWAVRERCAAASPALAARQIEQALQGGADELELRLDPDLDDDDPGSCGIGIGVGADLTTVLAGVDLTRVLVAFDGGSVLELAMLVQAARTRGTPASDLRAEIGCDPWQSATDSAWAKAAAMVTWCAARAPQVRPLTIDGRDFAEAGVGPGVELGLAGAALVDTVRRLLALGLPFPDIASALTWRLGITSEVLVETAKLRAARLVWAKVATAFAPAEPVPALPLLAYSAARQRSRVHDLRTNLIRGTLEAFAAVAGGCDALCLTPYEPHPDWQDDEARRLARGQQLLLREEAFLAKSADPTAGAFAAEALTDQIGRVAWSTLQEVEAQGGYGLAMRRGLLPARLEAATAKHLEGRRRRRRPLLGIDRYVDPELEGLRTRVIDRDREFAVGRAKLAAQRAARTPAERSAAEAALGRLGRPVGAMFVDDVLSAVGVGCAAFEIAAALAEPASDPPDHPAVSQSPSPFPGEARDLEDLRAHVEARGPIHAIVLPLGDDAKTAAQAAWVSDLLRAGGLDVRWPEIARAAKAAGEPVVAPSVAVVCGAATDLATTIADLRRSQVPPAIAVAGHAKPWPAGADVTLWHGSDVVTRLEYLLGLAEQRWRARASSAPDPELDARLAALRAAIAEDEEHA